MSQTKKKPFYSQLNIVFFMFRLLAVRPALQWRLLSQAWRWGPCDLLESASFGTFEPAITRPEVDPEVVLVPLLAFDSKGHRLGYGGGYYDRTLESFAERGVVSVGIAYEAQFLEKLPSDTKDVALNWIITEERSRNMRDAREPK